MKSVALLSLALTTAASAGTIGAIDSVKLNERIFNDRFDSTLNFVSNYPSDVRLTETGFGPGGFANRHSAYYSADGGASNLDINYEDAFDFSVTVNHIASQNVAVEAGFHADLFGFGYFGQLPNGEIAAFGSILPFHSFGVVPYADTIHLRMIHRPGSGNGVDPLPVDGVRSSFEYLYSFDGINYVSSGLKEMGGNEGGIPSNFNFFVGFGAQHNAAAETGAVADTIFNNIRVAVPAPAGVALAGLAGLAGLRRRR
ncbi:MAG: hypothetical protein SFZ24_02515 [Planctomycetota bacterium]|nr:hypothetical protein [Planctomycetota bacterium]